MAAVVGLLVLPNANAQAPAAAPAGGPAAERAIPLADLENLVRTIEDDAARARFLADLKTLIAAHRTAADEPPAGLLSRFAAWARQSTEHLVGVAASLQDLPQLARWAERQVADPAARARAVGLVVKLVALLAAALLAEGVVHRLLARPRRAVATRDGASVLVRVPLALAHALIELMPRLAFLAAGLLLIPIHPLRPEADAAVLVVMQAYVAGRAILVLARAVLVPPSESTRLIRLDPETAAYLLIWARRVTVLVITWSAAVQAALLLGMPAAGGLYANRVLALVAGTLAVIFVLQNRVPVAAWIRGRRPDGGTVSTLRQRLADVWHVLAVVYVAGACGAGAFGVKGGLAFMLRATVLSVVVLTLAYIAATLLKRVIERGFALNAETRRLYPGLEARANRYLPVLVAVVRAVIFAAAALALLQTWGLDAFAWLDTPLGRRVVGAAASIAIVVGLTVLAWETASAAIERYLAAKDADGRAVERSARVRTLLPLLRNVLMVTLVVVAGLVVLSEIGVNIGPLLAGAGVIGLAIGVGSQKLVQDVITGAFILFEDSVAVGDVVAAGGHSGVVEAITIRSIRLRDVEGRVHTVPFSTVDKVSNFTREYSYYLIDMGVAYREDTDEVAQVMRDVVDEMRREPPYADDILEPLDVMGVDRFADSAVIVRARIKTKPIKQWAAGREFNRRIKKAFDARGIEIPFPHQTLYFGVDKQGNAPPLNVRNLSVSDGRRAGPTNDGPTNDGAAPPRAAPASGEPDPK